MGVTMSLPFDAPQFLDVLERYNRATWPAPILLTGLAVVAAGFAARPVAVSGRVVSAVLAILWAWIGIAYHLAFFE